MEKLENFDRRAFLTLTAGVAASVHAGTARAESVLIAADVRSSKKDARWLDPNKRVDAGVLQVSYYETGPSEGSPVVLLHGFHMISRAISRSPQSSRRRVIALSYPTCGVMGKRSFLKPPPLDQVNRRQSGTTSLNSWMP